MRNFLVKARGYEKEGVERDSKVPSVHIGDYKPLYSSLPMLLTYYAFCVNPFIWRQQ